jgi:NAD(P)-dependent dehydrogenase (short-subunit alcohol dehydrogenase family)
MNFKTKTALITGASRGIGKAIALRLAQEGVVIGIHYKENEAEAASVVESIENQGGKAYLFQADLQETLQAIRLGEQAWEAMQGIDFLINNAGVSYKKHFLDTTENDFDFFNQVNFKSTFFLTQTIAKKMVETNVEGSIYTITSVNAIRPGLGLSAYGATKGALETLMKGVAMELAPHNIRVNTLVVGAIQTEMNASVRQNPELLKEVNEGIAIGRFGEAEEVANVVVSLLQSDSYITGTSITIDGGLLLMRGYGKPKKYEI